MSDGSDPYRYFRVEVRELLEGLSEGVLALEKGTSPEQAIARVLRLAHTLKGAARVVKQHEIADLAHALEDEIAAVRNSGRAPQRERIDAVLELLDAIAARAQALAPAPAAEAAARASPEEAFRTIRAEVAEMDALLDGIAEAGVALQSLRRVMATAERAHHLGELLASQLASPRSREGKAAGRAAWSKAPALAEELRTLVAGLDAGLGAGVEAASRELRQIRERAERLRLVPVSSMLPALERTARDTAQAAGTPVAFEARGGEVRVDAQVLAGIQSALVQLVRNAVAHGIEPEAERRAGGKPVPGRVAVEAARRGGKVAFRCRDDGRGVDLEAVRRVARERGLLSPESAPLSAGELWRLLLKGGLSTSATVTGLSGRGVGLDIVREAAAQLGGDITVQTGAREGTTVEVVVPVSLASVPALLVEVGGTVAAIPLGAVQAAVRLVDDTIVRAAGAGAIVHDGETVPLLPLSRVLGGAAAGDAGRPRSGLIVQGGGRRAAVSVDRIRGAATVLVRPLPALAQVDVAVAGVALDAEGDPQVVLDPDELVAAADRPQPVVGPEEGRRPLPLLVVDDSLTTRMLEQSILESAGYEVELAVSAEEALEKARRRRYGLFLVDVEMPGLDGFGFVERTRGDPLLREVPSILVTSRSSPEDRRRGEQVGARAYIVKSEFEQSALLETIRALVS